MHSAAEEMNNQSSCQNSSEPNPNLQYLINLNPHRKNTFYF